MISKYGRHVINRRPLYILKKKKKKKKKSNGAQLTLCGFLGKTAYITEFSCQFCILNTRNFFGFLFEVSLKCGQSCGRTVLKTRQWNPGHFGSDFRDGAPCMYKYQESGIFVMKVESLLDILTCSVLLKSFLGDLGKQYKLPTPLKRHMSGLALQGLSDENLRS